MKKVLVGSGSAYWGDVLEPAVEMAKKSDVQYIGFDHLAELTMSILNRMKEKNPEKGYIEDIVPWMKELLPITMPKGIKMITDAGGANPLQAALEVCIGSVLGGILSWSKHLNLATTGEEVRKDGLVASHVDVIAANGAREVLSTLAKGPDPIASQLLIEGSWQPKNKYYAAPETHQFGKAPKQVTSLMDPVDGTIILSIRATLPSALFCNAPTVLLIVSSKVLSAELP